MYKNQTENWKQDEDGVWWYHFGKTKPTRTRGLVKECFRCGEPFLLIPQRLQCDRGEFCSRSCGTRERGGHRDKKGFLSHNWKGGVCRLRSGYVEEYCPDHPFARGKKYVRQHRLVMEKHLGRYLEPYETVHHRNGIRHDNRIENLELRFGAHGAGVRYEDIQSKSITICVSAVKLNK